MAAPVVDVHVHIFEEKMWPRKFLNSLYAHRKKIFSAEEFKRYKAEAKAEILIKEMDEAGVDISVCLPVDFAFMCQEEPEISAWKANEYVAEAQARYPGRIIGFFGCDPMRPGAVEMLEKGIKKLGLKGVKIFPGWFFPTDERIASFIQKVEELSVPVLFHSGVDPHPFVVKYGHPQYLDDLLLKYPKLKIIAAHVSRGWGELLIQLMVYRPGNLWTDLATMQLETMYSHWHFLTQMRYVMDRVPDATLFGSDWPFLKSGAFPSAKGWVDVIKTLKLPQARLDMGMKQFTGEEKEKILGGNAQKLLNL